MDSLKQLSEVVQQKSFTLGALAAAAIEAVGQYGPDVKLFIWIDSWGEECRIDVDD